MMKLSDVNQNYIIQTSNNILKLRVEKVFIELFDI